MEIFIAKNDQQTGPFSIEQLESMIAAGMIQSTDMVWHSGLTNWIAAHQLLDSPPPLPKIHESTDLKIISPKPKQVGDLLASVFFGFCYLVFIFAGVSGLAVAVRLLGKSDGPGAEVILTPVFGVILLILAFTILLAYRYFHRRYLGLHPMHYKGAFGTKMKTSESIPLLVGGTLFSLASGFPIPHVSPILMVIATLMFAFSFDRVKQRYHLKQIRKQAQPE